MKIKNNIFTQRNLRFFIPNETIKIEKLLLPLTGFKKVWNSSNPNPNINVHFNNFDKTLYVKIERNIKDEKDRKKMNLPEIINILKTFSGNVLLHDKFFQVLFEQKY